MVSRILAIDPGNTESGWCLIDAAAAVCEVRGLPHLVARLDRAANEIRSQEDMEADA